MVTELRWMSSTGLRPVEDQTSMERLQYTGVGSRQTPELVCGLCRRLAARLEKLGWGLRSGGAEGADAAFEAGVQDPGAMTIYVPWARNEHPAHYVAPNRDLQVRAAEIAAEIHPRWRGLSRTSRLLHTRNVFEVLGSKLDSPSRFVVCWTADGAEREEETSSATGGTRTAIVLAHRYGVPVMNLARVDAMERLRRLVQGEEGTVQ